MISQEIAFDHSDSNRAEQKVVSAKSIVGCRQFISFSLLQFAIAKKQHRNFSWNLCASCEWREILMCDQWSFMDSSFTCACIIVIIITCFNARSSIHFDISRRCGRRRHIFSVQPIDCSRTLLQQQQQQHTHSNWNGKVGLNERTDRNKSSNKKKKYSRATNRFWFSANAIAIDQDNESSVDDTFGYANHGQSRKQKKKCRLRRVRTPGKTHSWNAFELNCVRTAKSTNAFPGGETSNRECPSVRTLLISYINAIAASFQCSAQL